MKKQNAITWLALMGVTGVVGMNAALAAPFYDNFDRADSTTVGNGWTQGTGGGAAYQPQISSSQAAFFGTNGAGGYCASDISHTFDAVPVVSVDFKWERKSGLASDPLYMMGLGLTGTTTSLSIYDWKYDTTNQYYPISIQYNGKQDWINVSTGDNIYRTYSVVSTGSSTRLYVNNALVWTSPDAGIGMMTQATISEASWYTPWLNFYADNFAAVPEPASLALLGLGALGLLRRRR